MKKTFLTIFLFIFLVSSSIALAEERKEPSGGAVLFDVVLARPLGVVSIVLGSAVFVVGLPFTIPTGTVGLSARKLVGEPFSFTFVRPVGDVGEGMMHY